MKARRLFLVGFCILAACCTNKRKNIENNECKTIKTDTQTVIVDSAILLFPNIKTSGNEVYAMLDEKPEFPGGMKELIKFIQQNILYPPVALQKKIQGRVVVEGIIDTDGKIIQPKVVYGVDSLLDKEALRIIEMIPDWRPGKLSGEAVKVKFRFPVTFKISDYEEKKAVPVILEDVPERNPQNIGSVKIEYIPPVNADTSTTKTIPGLKWGHLTDNNEGVFKVYFNEVINQMCHEKIEDIIVNGISISRSKVYIPIVRSNYNLIYKGEADFYLEDKQKKLHKILGKDVDKESVACYLEKGKTTGIDIDFPDNCQPGDYLLKVKIHNENGKCCYVIYKWFEAYTSHRTSSRDKPIPLGPALPPDYKVPSGEDDIYDVVQNMPEFPGGMPGLMEFIRQNIQYPQAARQSKLEGRVIMQVVIDKDGSVTQPRILRSINPMSDVDAVFCEEALRIVSIMPKWKPGSQHGMNMKVRFTFPIKFESPTD